MKNVLLIGLALFLGSLWWNVDRACAAYIATPNIEPFGVFADPSIRKLTSKFSYLFNPMVLPLLYGLVMLPIPTRWLDRRFGERGVNTLSGRIFVVGLLMFIVHMPIAINSDDALAAAYRSNWHGKSVPTGLLGAICSVTGRAGI